MDNYPMMSASELERAPWNEPLDIEYEVTVCTSVIDIFNVTMPYYKEKGLIRDSLKEKINKIILDKYENVEDFEIIEYQ